MCDTHRVIFTIGHSTLSQDAFTTLIGDAAVELVWDVRSYPVSHWPWFRRELMQEWLPRVGVGYRWAPALGGRRGTRRTRDDEAARLAAAPVPQPPVAPVARPAAQEPLPLAWHEAGFVNYQWHMTTEEFLRAADELARLGGRIHVAIMCAEAVWWRCHRSMIADYLVVADSEVVHLQPQPTPHRDVMGDRLQRYDPDVLAAWRAHLAADAGA